MIFQKNYIENQTNINSSTSYTFYVFYVQMPNGTSCLHLIIIIITYLLENWKLNGKSIWQEYNAVGIGAEVFVFGIHSIQGAYTKNLTVMYKMENARLFILRFSIYRCVINFKWSIHTIHTIIWTMECTTSNTTVSQMQNVTSVQYRKRLNWFGHVYVYTILFLCLY